MIRFLLATSVAAEVCAALAVAFSIRFPGRAIWPPNPPAPWKAPLMSLLFLYPAAGIGILGIAEWGSPALAAGTRLLFGLPPLLAGTVLFLWAAAVLGARPTFGADGPLVRTGPFRFTRNPQYAGCLLMLLGWSCLSASPAAAAASLFGFPALLIVPIAEERRLLKTYGPAYEEYRKRVPRFF
jgi:protein-S-isoprenylcysteine O-methyltransferase Ste14